MRHRVGRCGGCRCAAPSGCAGRGARRCSRGRCSPSPRSRRSSTSASATSRGTPRWKDFEFITYREYVGVSTTLLLFVALTAPDVICPDRRNRVLPLIFARPLDGRDYVFVKLGAIFAIVFGFAFIPHVVLFVGQMLVIATAPSTTSARTPRCCGRCRSPCRSWPCTTPRSGSRWRRLSTRRVVGGVAFLGVVFVTLDRRRRPRRGERRGPVVVGGRERARPAALRSATSSSSATSTPRGRWPASTAPGSSPSSSRCAVIGACIAYLLRRYRQVEL